MPNETPLPETNRPFRILSLDGGGSLGVYTLGVLAEVERALGRPLHEAFDLVYGASTGSIVASMIGLGEAVEEIAGRYFALAPAVLGPLSARGKSAALDRHARELYGAHTFESLRVDTGILATCDHHPVVFKRDFIDAHREAPAFAPGAGLRVADAVVASCAASPFLLPRSVAVPGEGVRTMLDGGFAASSPALFALADALGPLGVPRGEVRMLSVGTGGYPAHRGPWRRLVSLVRPIRTFMRLIRTNARTTEALSSLLFPDVCVVRIDEWFTEQACATDFMETDPEKLRHIFGLGRASFAGREGEIKEFFARTRTPLGG